MKGLMGITVLLASAYAIVAYFSGILGGFSWPLSLGAILILVLSVYVILLEYESDKKMKKNNLELEALKREVDELKKKST